MTPRSLLACLALCALPLLTGCAGAPASGDNLTAYAAALQGIWSNASQMAQAPDDMKVIPADPAAGDWIDAQTVRFAAAADPGTLSADWTGGDGRTRHETWTFRKGDGPVTLAIVGEGAPGSGNPACILTVIGAGKGAWNAQTDPERCRIATPKGEADLLVRITVMPTGLLYDAVARLPDDVVAFRRPGGTPYDLRRVP